MTEQELAEGSNMTSLSTVTCKLPPGSGSDIDVHATLSAGDALLVSDYVSLVSYAKPSIDAMIADGCSPLSSDPRVLENCPRGSNVILTYVALCLVCCCVCVRPAVSLVRILIVVLPYAI